MINGSRYIVWEGDLLLFIGRPQRRNTVRSKTIEVVNPFHHHAVVDVHKPSANKSTSTRSRNNELEVRHDKSLGGELEGVAVW